MSLTPTPCRAPHIVATRKGEHAREFTPVKRGVAPTAGIRHPGVVRLGFEVLHERCAGIDVHKRQVTVCVKVPGREEIREFATDTMQLLAMVDWLQEQRVDDMAMEATGSYWKPVYNLLEASGLRPIVGNAAHLKAVPGRKTDVKVLLTGF